MQGSKVQSNIELHPPNYPEIGCHVTYYYTRLRILSYTVLRTGRAMAEDLLWAVKNGDVPAMEKHLEKVRGRQTVRGGEGNCR